MTRKPAMGASLLARRRPRIEARRLGLRRLGKGYTVYLDLTMLDLAAGVLAAAPPSTLPGALVRAAAEQVLARPERVPLPADEVAAGLEQVRVLLRRPVPARAAYTREDGKRLLSLALSCVAGAPRTYSRAGKRFSRAGSDVLFAFWHRAATIEGSFYSLAELGSFARAIGAACSAYSVETVLVPEPTALLGLCEAVDAGLVAYYEMLTKPGSFSLDLGRLRGVRL